MGSDVYAPPRVDVTPDGLPDLGVPADIWATLVIEGRRYVVDSLTVRRVADGPAITSDLIRRIPVHTIVKYAVAGAAVMHRNGRPAGMALPDDLLTAARAAGPTDETLALVAQLYVIAELTGDPPAKSVRTILEIPTATAGNWIRRAKDRGHLDG